MLMVQCTLFFRINIILIWQKFHLLSTECFSEHNVYCGLSSPRFERVGVYQANHCINRYTVSLFSYHNIWNNTNEACN